MQNHDNEFHATSFLLLYNGRLLFKTESNDRSSETRFVWCIVFFINLFASTEASKFKNGEC